MKCEGCEEEMIECYKWQSKGYDAGFTWHFSWADKKFHCFVFVLNKKGKLIVE